MMKLSLTTDPTIEPVTTTELKELIRAESTDYADQLDLNQSIAPGSQATAADYGLEGTGVDVLNKRTLVRLNAGDCSAGTVDVKIQESDDDSTYTDWTGGSFTQVDSDNDNAIQEKEYTGTKQYIRAVATVATGACSFGVSIEVESATHPEDTLLGNLITVARQHAENYTGRALITQTWTGYMDCFPIWEDYYRLEKSPVQSVTSIKYRDSDGDWTTWDADNYILDAYTFVPRVYLDYDESWPSYTEYPVNSVETIFVAGYGDNRSDVPRTIRDAILRHAATMYEFREDIEQGRQPHMIPPPYTVNYMLDHYVVEAR